ELTKRTVHLDLVARLQAEHVRRHDARRNTLRLRRRCCDTDIKLHNTFFFRVVRHGVSTNDRLSDLGLQVKEAEALPVTTELRLDVEIGIFNMVWRTFKLNITTRTAVNVFTFRQTQCQLLNKGSHVRVGLYGTF